MLAAACKTSVLSHVKLNEHRRQSLQCERGTSTISHTKKRGHKRVTHSAVIDAGFSKMAVHVIELMTLGGLVKGLNGDGLWDEGLKRLLLAGFDGNGRGH